ncbi:MAG: heme-binding protein [Candidatus Pedobacter colombiensis]|uniref:Heme-binding protein n=1 Tax=Candidatus Pedobacter colombiensis TaxID=3121371 RepID=A0AAJ6B6P8_9SPHI|nr:heme-binding protein [Pedobacter sp.]WEK20252.1 MAG: heme-binding protein [Pedobacter sp.]
MKPKELKTTIASLIDHVSDLVPLYMENEEDKAKANGNVAICLVDAEGMVYGKVFGTDKIRGREAFRVAWVKASQVWITGFKTGEYERLVFNNEIEESRYGIRKPDYVGWEGGQPISLADGTVLSVGFSGFRSATDLEIVHKALSLIPGAIKNNESTNIYQTI